MAFGAAGLGVLFTVIGSGAAGFAENLLAMEPTDFGAAFGSGAGGAAVFAPNLLAMAFAAAFGAGAGGSSS